MPKISSDLTNKSFAATPLPQFDVPDATHQHETPSIDFEALDIQRQERGLPPLDEKTKRAMYASMQQQEEELPVRPQTTNVPAAQHLQDFERKVETVRRAKQTGQERLTSSARARIAALCEMSQGTQTVELDGNAYVMQTLKAKDHRAAIVAATAFDGTSHAAFEVRKQLMARAIIKIGGYDVELFLGDDSLEARLEFIEELPEAVLIKLYSEYLDLAQASQNKYFIKNEAEAKEVMEDLKK